MLLELEINCKYIIQEDPGDLSILLELEINCKYIVQEDPEDLSMLLELEINCKYIVKEDPEDLSMLLELEINCKEMQVPNIPCDIKTRYNLFQFLLLGQKEPKKK